MRIFQRLFTNNHIKYKYKNRYKNRYKYEYKTIRVSNIKIPPSFYKIPYDEQYESRDFKIEKKDRTSYL